MATWKAEVFVNSSVGKISTTVDAATYHGAEEQIYAKHGDVQQIWNLRQVSSGDSSSDGGSIGAWFSLACVIFCIWLLIEYWWIVVPILAICIFLFILGSD